MWGEQSFTLDYSWKTSFLEFLDIKNRFSVKKYTGYSRSMAQRALAMAQSPSPRKCNQITPGCTTSRFAVSFEGLEGTHERKIHNGNCMLNYCTQFVELHGNNTAQTSSSAQVLKVRSGD